MCQYQIAQVNVAQAVDDMESETMSGFVSRLDEINLLADNSPGFVWRLQSDEGNATSIQATDDPRLIINISVWDDIESLKYFVYRSVHVELIQDRDAWFNKVINAHQVLWWVPKGTQPTEQDALAKLQQLRINGPDQDAFTFAKSYPKPKKDTNHE